MCAFPISSVGSISVSLNRAIFPSSFNASISLFYVTASLTAEDFRFLPRWFSVHLPTLLPLANRALQYLQLFWRHLA